MPTCARCGNTGVIETGNNDIPCDCPAGDTVIFTRAGVGEITGAEIKRLDALPQLPRFLDDRIEFGVQFFWSQELRHWYAIGEHMVVVEPPATAEEDWLVKVPAHDICDRLSGHEAERRSFAVAKGYVLMGQTSAA